MGESGEPRSIQVDSQGLVADSQSVYSHIELTSPDAKRLRNVFLTDVRVYPFAVLRGIPPSGHFTGFGEHEYAFALALGSLNE